MPWHPTFGFVTPIVAPRGNLTLPVPKVIIPIPFRRLTLKPVKGTIFGRIHRNLTLGEAAAIPSPHHAIRPLLFSDQFFRGICADAFRLSKCPETRQGGTSWKSSCA